MEAGRVESFEISIHAPHTGRDPSKALTMASMAVISIHAPHTGRDVKDVDMELKYLISIHAPHTGRDFWATSIPSGFNNFNPRAPYGARPGKGGSDDG